jgi:4-amino-4-deoxychorismate lyase
MSIMGSTFIETIKIVDGEILNLEFHERRSSDTILYHYGINRVLPLRALINSHDIDINMGVLKLRVIYSFEILNYTITPYIPRNVKSLKLVDGGEIDYGHKYENRDTLNTLLLLRGDCDDILIVKNGLVTDTSYSNFVFGDGTTLFTPTLPLLRGTKREYLLERGVIKERNLSVEEIARFSSFYLINSMVDMAPVYEIF